MDSYIILKDEKRREACITFIRTTPLGFAVEIKPHRNKRTNQQNRYMWSLNRAIGDFMGDDEKKTHKFCKVRLLGVEDCLVDGVLLIEPRSTTTLSTIEMNRYLEKLEMLAREIGANFIRPDDYQEIMGAK